ncbi:Asp-tRNA(Asn)/Glu-tRNA(Gln) amidotransferase subunit GatB [Candidatus Uhrbacteria bacterium]|nr:Asp-tRNA(Asn)/Glu-tRNA(Gln) amidotransferase subunit GatB [Candidatus Uhrbacteria bacterium]
MKLEPVIGLEIHVQLKTKSKMFCSCQNGVETPANSAICPICMGHPGTLPVPNKQAIEYAVMAALALHCTIAEETHFDRKHYFYPDLPKGYQISQYKNPLGERGKLEINSQKPEARSQKQSTIGITRVHMEEDAGKLIHAADGSNALVDYNRAGTPLIEIVTEPDFRSPEEAKSFLEELKRIMRTIGVSDADMEKGQLRCDANISLRPEGDKKFYPKTEVKNMNSFKAVERALAYEIQRQAKLWEAGTPPTTLETRGWNDAQQQTEEQRTKEEAHDYRYFPEPDIPPLKFGMQNAELRIEEIRRKLPELPQAKRKRFIEQYDMDPSDALILTEDKTLADWTEHVLTELRAWLVSLEGAETEEERWHAGKKKLVKLTTGWITSKLFALHNASGAAWSDLKITPENFGEFISLLSTGKVNSTVGQEVLGAMYRDGVDPSSYIDEKKLAQMDDVATITEAVESVIGGEEKVVAEYKAGKTAALKFLLGKTMRALGGKANPTQIEKILKQKLQS